MKKKFKVVLSKQVKKQLKTIPKSVKKEFDKKMEQDKKAEIEFFDQFKDGYDVLMQSGYNRLADEFLTVNPDPKDKIVEFGCGTGSFTKELFKYSHNITGIDISQKFIRYAEDHHDKNIKFMVDDIESTGIENESADIVIFSGVLHHFPDPKKVMDEAYRILKVGGKFFSYDPNKRNPIIWLYRSPKSPVSTNKGMSVNERLISRKELHIKFEQAGFFNVRCYGISGVSHKYINDGFAKKFLTLYNFINNNLLFSKQIGSFLICIGEK